MKSYRNRPTLDLLIRNIRTEINTGMPSAQMTSYTDSDMVELVLPAEERYVFTLVRAGMRKEHAEAVVRDLMPATHSQTPDVYEPRKRKRGSILVIE